MAICETELGSGRDDNAHVSAQPTLTQNKIHAAILNCY